MPATARTATQVTHTAVSTLLADPGTAADVVNNDSFPNGGNTLLVMNNTDSGSHTVEVTPTTLVDGLAVTARSYTIPATSIRVVKLGPVSTYGSTVITVTSSALVKLQAFAL